MNLKKVGNNIREARIKKNMTQDDLAKKLYVSRKAISTWEIGRQSPSVDSLLMLSSVLNVSVDEILVDFNPKKVRLVHLKHKLNFDYVKNILYVIVGIFLYFSLNLNIYDVISIAIIILLVELKKSNKNNINISLFSFNTEKNFGRFNIITKDNLNKKNNKNYK